jgi:hypothetical protein
MSPAVGLRSAALPAEASFSDHFLLWLLFLLCGIAGCMVGNGTRIFPILRLTSGHFEQMNTLFPLQAAQSIIATLSSNLQIGVRAIYY